jgi:hypothetical protein
MACHACQVPWRLVRTFRYYLGYYLNNSRDCCVGTNDQKDLSWPQMAWYIWVDLESREFGRGNPLCWPCDTLYPQKLAPTSPTSGGLSVGIVRSRTRPRNLFFCLYIYIYIYMSTFKVSWRLVRAFKQFCRLHLRKLKDCNVDITCGRKFWYKPLRCLHVAWYSYEFSGRLIQVLKQYCGFHHNNLMDVTLGFLMESKYEVHRWDGLRWHDIVTYTSDTRQRPLNKRQHNDGKSCQKHRTVNGVFKKVRSERL